jgi:hypothetical protein
VAGSTAAILPASPHGRGAREDWGENGPDKQASSISDGDVEQKTSQAHT